MTAIQESPCESGPLTGAIRIMEDFAEYTGLVIGLRAVERLLAAGRDEGGAGERVPGPLAEEFRRHLPLADRIQRFWTDPADRAMQG